MSSRSRRQRIEANSFEFWIAFAALLVAAQFFVAPGNLTQTPVGRALPPWDLVWNIVLLLGSALILIGLWIGRADFEVGGLVFTATAIAIQVIAILVAVGSAGGVSAFIFTGVAWACLSRARAIAREKPEDP